MYTRFEVSKLRSCMHKVSDFLYYYFILKLNFSFANNSVSLQRKKAAYKSNCTREQTCVSTAADLETTKLSSDLQLVT
jgi:hypothetical protein